MHRHERDQSEVDAAFTEIVAQHPWVRIRLVSIGIVAWARFRLPWVSIVIVLGALGTAWWCAAIPASIEALARFRGSG